MEHNISTFLSSVVAGCDAKTTEMCFFVGVDVGDAMFEPATRASPQATYPVPLPMGCSPGLRFFDEQRRLVAPATTCAAYLFNEPRGKVCAIWRHLARLAVRDAFDFFVLLGDDVVIQTPNWFAHIVREFERMHASAPAVPFGFGCVAVQDTTHSFFPTFPVVHKTHMEIFGDEIFPDVFFNQDADPFLYEIYKRWNCSTFAQCSLSNNVGGGDHAETTRYEKQHTDWTYELLADAVRTVTAWLDGRLPRAVVLDVVVPTHRLDLSYLQRILALKGDERIVTKFFVVVDNPTDTTGVAKLRALCSAALRGDQYRIFVNERNRGAAFSRNIGLYESWADWILFLDDDVVPRDDLLLRYAECIRAAAPHVAGFVGLTKLPDPQDAFSMAVKLLRVTDFWEVCNKPAGTISWGVSANLVTRRIKSVKFDDELTGGEDIDYCIRLLSDGASLLGAPSAAVDHAWWSDGQAHLQRWAEGDGALFDLHPQYTYRDVPDAAESAALLSAAALALGLSPAVCLVPVWIFIVEAVLFYVTHSASPRFGMASLSPPQKAVVAWHAALILVRASFGRMRGHWRRGGIVGVLRHVGHRFDWSVGSVPNYVRIMRHGSMVQFAVFMLLVPLLLVAR
jgi:hypothetical protein